MSQINDGTVVWRVKDIRANNKVDTADFEEQVPFAFGINGDDYGYYKEGEQELTPFGAGGARVQMNDVTGAATTPAVTTVAIVWSDPEDVVYNQQTIVEWDKTVVVRKLGTPPTSQSDGTVVVTNRIRNQYASNGFIDTGLIVNNTYYYRFFVYSKGGGVTAGQSVSATTAPVTISAVPTQDGTLTYDGNEQTAVFANYNTAYLTVSGNKGTNAGNYTATFTPREGVQWSDETTTGKDVTWSIAKANGSVSVSTNSVTLDKDNTTATITVSNGSGAITITSSDSTIVTVSPASMDAAGGTLTLTATGKSGSPTVTVSAAATTNYNSASQTIDVSCEFLKIVTWAGGTDQEIADMVAAADAGSIDLTEYWNIGDERSISLSAMSATGVGESHVAQTVTFVLVAKDTKTSVTTTNPCYNYKYVTATTGRTYPSFIVQQKNGLANGTTGEYGYMNSSNTNSGSWGSCARKTWCDSVYKPAIPSSIRDIFKQVKVRTIAVYNGSTMQDSNCYFFLPAAAEIYKGDSSYGQGGTAGAQTAYSNLTEFNELCRWEYYATSANRIKKNGNSGSANYWWERSPRYNNATSFCCVIAGGSANSSVASNALLIAPAGCI